MKQAKAKWREFGNAIYLSMDHYNMKQAEALPQ